MTTIKSVHVSLFEIVMFCGSHGYPIRAKESISLTLLISHRMLRTIESGVPSDFRPIKSSGARHFPPKLKLSPAHLPSEIKTRDLSDQRQKEGQKILSLVQRRISHANLRTSDVFQPAITLLG